MLDNRILIIYNEEVSKILPFLIYGLMVKRLRHRPFTAESGVRFPLRLPNKKAPGNRCFFIIVKWLYLKPLSYNILNCYTIKILFNFL